MPVKTETNKSTDNKEEEKKPNTFQAEHTCSLWTDNDITPVVILLHPGS